MLFLAGFLLSLGFHIWGVSVGWNHGNLPGQEFRQTQTAITAHFIQQDNDFTLDYPTPVLGKPWSVPFEFPLYQWTVVAVSNMSGMDLIPAGRLVSTLCFYLSLPAIWILLGRIGVRKKLRWLVLSLVVCCPIYIFYSRSFLIETMALVFSLWFWVGYVVGVENRSKWWIALAVVAGVGAGLVKVTTFMLYLMPAFVWTIWWYAQAWRSNGPWPWKAWRRLTVWAGLAVVLPFAATLGWLEYADYLKSLNPGGSGLMSSKMRDFNLGTWETRTSSTIWAAHGRIMITNIVAPGILFGTLLVGIVSVGRWWRWSMAAVFFFFAVQVLFPELYAWHEYYYVANAVFVLVAIGLILVQLWESPTVGSARAWLVSLIFIGLQISLYFEVLYQDQVWGSRGGNGVTDTLNIVTEENDVVVIAGEDWSSITPFYARRRAWMLRNNTEEDWAMIDATMENLRDDTIGALLLRGDQRANQGLIKRVTNHFGLEQVPSIRWPDADLFLNPARYEKTGAVKTMIESWGASVSGQALGDDIPEGHIRLTDLPAQHLESFVMFDPRPLRYKADFGVGTISEGDTLFFSAHPYMALWFDVETGVKNTEVEFKLAESAYEGVVFQDQSDGVEMHWIEVLPDGAERTLFYRYLNPRDEPKDRGLQTIQATFEIAAESELELRITAGPNGNASRDWATISRVKID
ncbi:glycosyltransferase family 39 protein [Opitutaceae bacterium]|nr:glycosyltransferase family 39 protein [Opitutaceae bacterium]MDB4474121.1 glycosyltransferase family 39 protein [Opitutaceae bacterium]